jgi:hypothetical protein
VISIIFFFIASVKRNVAFWLSVLLAAQVALWLLGDQFHDTALNDSETYGFAFTLLGFSIGSIAGLAKARAAKMTMHVLCGVCLGLAVLSKELFIFSVIPAWLMAARRWEGAWDWGQLRTSAAGGIAVGILFLIYLVTHSALIPYLEILRFSRAFAANYCVDIGRFPNVSGFVLLQRSWTMLHDQLYNLRHLAFILALWTSVPLLLLRRDRMMMVAVDSVTAAAAVVLGMVAISVGHCFWNHYYLMGTTGLLLFSVIGAEALTDFLSRRAAWATAMAFVVLSALFVIVARYPTQRMLAEKHAPNRVISVDSSAVEVIKRHSQEGDYILDTESALLYVVLNRKSPLPLVGFTDEFLLAGMRADVRSMRIDTLRQALEQHPPKVCYFSSWFRPRQELYHRLLFDPFLTEHHYVKVNDQLWYLPDAK